MHPYPAGGRFSYEPQLAMGWGPSGLVGMCCEVPVGATPTVNEVTD